MSNHAHFCITDNRGVLPLFVGKMNSLIARQLNTLRAEKGTNFEKRYSDIDILDPESLVELCAYTLANPCAAGLVSTAAAWKSVSTYHLEYNEPLIVKRPNCGMWRSPGKGVFRVPRSYSTRKRRPKKRKASERMSRPMKYRKESQLPKEVVGVLVRPDIMPQLSDRALRAKIRLETQQRERLAAELREKEGLRVLGMRRVIKMRWNDSPSTIESIFEATPRVAVRSEVHRAHERSRIAAFNAAYQFALETFHAEGRERAIFPWGTWKMKMQFHARCETGPPR